MTPLFFLLWRSLVGRWTRWLRLMRQPKYLVGTLAGLSWIGMFALRPALSANRTTLREPPASLMEWLPAVETGASLALLVGLSLWWLWPFGKASLELTETELHLLLPAPVRRRHLIQYATLRSQWGILFGCFMLSVFSSGGAPGIFAWRFVSAWCVLTLWHLHGRGRALWLARLRELPAAVAWRRRVLVVAGVTVLWMVMTPGLVSVLASLPPFDADTMPALRTALTLERVRAQAPLAALFLAPARWVLGPLVAGLTPQVTWVGRVAAMAWPLLLIVVHNEWVVQSQTRFEEATLERSRRQAATGDAASRFRRVRRRRRQQAPFTLRPVGRPEIAIVWKNLMLAHRTRLVWVIGAGAATFGLAAIVVTFTGLPDWLIATMTIAGAIGLVVTPMVAGHQWRNDLRTDLLRLDVLRTWPIDGWRLFASQVAPPAIVATLYATAAGGLLLVAGLAASATDASSMVLVPPGLAASLGVSPVTLLLLGLATALPLVAVVATLSATLQNLLALLWPSWIQLGQHRNGSAAHIGQGILTGLGLLLALAVGLLPGALLVGAWLFLQLRVADLPLTAWQLPVLGTTAVIPLVVIVGLLTRFGGVLWDQLDPSSELLGAGRTS
ncbi:MAG: hypothetical protein O3A25_15760 [Acidobacteria bacterium]|nr:hypothetical protein [Acidobacteriota bacterium]